MGRTGRSPPNGNKLNMSTLTLNPATPKRSLWWLYLLLAIPVIGITAFVVFQPIVVLPRITLAPGYTLTDQFGELATSEDRRGRITLYSFSYPECTVNCPQSTDSLSTIAADLPAIADLVTINLAEQAPADPTQFSWPYLSGKQTLVKQVVGSGFDAYYRQDSPTDIYFEPRFILVDKLGLIRAYYLTSTPDLALIERDINYLLEEEKNSVGVATVGYEAAHLFLCYPR